MYKSFFHLNSNPFNMSPDPRFLYMMPQTREALAGLEHGIAARKGFIVLVGEVGTGKTTLLRHAIGSFEKGRIFTSYIFNPRLDFLDFLDFVLNDFGIKPATRTKSGMLIELNRWLIERYRRNQTCVIVVDEAQELSSELLEEIRLLTNLETSSEKLVQIILSGQPELEEKLRQPELRQLRQRVSLWCRTGTMSSEQTEAYIVQRLSIAGTDDEIFTSGALAAVHNFSRGTPRIVNLLCEHALLLAYAEQMHTIPEHVIVAVAQELDLEPQLFPVPMTHASLLMGDKRAGEVRQPSVLTRKGNG